MQIRTQAQRPAIGELDIVIPVYGQYNLLQKCLDAIPNAAEDVKYTTVLVDDAFDPALTTSSIKTTVPMNILRNPENKGFGATCNRGAKVGSAPFILFLNTDVELLPGAMERMIRFMQKDSNIAVAGPKLLFEEDQDDAMRPAGKVQHAGMEINIHGDPYHIFMGWDRNDPKVNQVRQVPAVTGAVMMIRRDLFQRVGGFDPIWGRGTFDDVDICYKMIAMGKVVAYIPQAEGYHKVGASVIPSGQGYPLQQNNSLFKARWMGQIRWTDWEVW
jgi:GT2 family glycosyltransferase